jgi:hypothetical protein
MSNIEDRECWQSILELKDSLTLKELAQRFATTPGAVSAAFKRTGTARLPAPMSRHTQALPPEPGDHGVDAADNDDRSPRPGSKDALISAHADQLGRVPDAEIAKRAGVSVRTIASYRARNDIAGYRGPRRSSGKKTHRRSRIDPFAELLGQVPDRVVAEKAGVSLNAVRNYRVKLGISAAGRARSPRPVMSLTAEQTGGLAWRVTWRRSDGSEGHAVLLAADLVEAARQAQAANLGGVVVTLELAGSLLA